MAAFLEFHLWDHLQLQSGGFLTSLKLDESEIRERQDRVIKILERYSWVQIIETQEGPWIDFSEVWEHKTKRIMSLLQENFVLIDALHYLSSETVASWESISDISQSIMVLKMKMFSEPENKPDIYNFVDVHIWEIISDLENDIFRGVFEPSEREVQEIEWLKSTRDRFIEFFNSRWWSVMIGWR